MSRKHLDAEEKEDLLLYLDSLLHCVNALQASVGEVMADVMTMRDTILADQQELAIQRSGKQLATQSTKALDAGMCTDARYADLMMEIANTQQYKN
jgi:hypothetical protein